MKPEFHLAGRRKLCRCLWQEKVREILSKKFQIDVIDMVLGSKLWYTSKAETRRFLENLGFVTGGIVTVVSDIGGNMIVNVRESRVAIGKDMANKIIV